MLTQKKDSRGIIHFFNFFLSELSVIVTVIVIVVGIVVVKVIVIVIVTVNIVETDEQSVALTCRS